MKHTISLLLLVSIASTHVGRGASAQADSVRDQRTRSAALWDPGGPGCILWRAGHPSRPEHLPPPYRSPRIRDLFGPGVTEDHLAQGLYSGTERGPKLLTGADGAQSLIVFTDPPNVGFFDPVLGAARQAAFAIAVGRVVGMVDDHDIVISFDVSMPALGTSGPLASGVATQYHQDGDFPFPDAWYGEPLASHLDGADPDTDALDITIQFNSTWDMTSTPWFYGTGTAGPNAYHFIDVAMHEIVHGLDFASSLTSSGALLFEDPAAFDLFLEKTSGSSLVDLPDVPSTVTGNNVVFDGGTAGITWRNHLDQSGDPPIFAPTPFAMNSSLSHFIEAAPFTGDYELMSPNGEVGIGMLDVDPIVRGVLTDLGWNLHFAAVYVTLPTYGGPQTGKPHQPFIAVTSGLSAAASEGKGELFLSSGSHDVSALVINQPVTLHAWPGTTVLE